jgi:hypothetical protein
LRRELPLLAADLLEHLAHVRVEVAVVGRARQLRLPALPVDRHRVGAVDHVVAVRDGERQPQLGMDEGVALDHALLRIVAVEQPVDPGEEGVAVGDAGALPAASSAARTRLAGSGCVEAHCGIEASRPWSCASSAVLRGEALQTVAIACGS